MKQALLISTATLALGTGLGLTLGQATPPVSSGSQEEVLRLLAGQQALLETLPARLAAQAGSQQVQCAVAASSGAGADIAALRAELAQVRQELAQARGDSPRTPEPPEEPPAQSLAAQQRSHQIIEEASRSGSWRTEDAQALRQLLIGMEDPQRKEVISRLIVLLNSGKLQSHAEGPIF